MDWEFLAGFLGSITKLAGDPDEILIQGEHGSMTRKQVSDYYLHPKIRAKLLPQLHGKPVMLVQHHGEDIIRRKGKGGQEITIEEGLKGPGDPSDYMNHIHQKTVEFHPTHGETVDHLYVDLDPQGNIPWERTKAIVKQVAHTMRTEPDVTGTRVVYSGGRGFHVKGKLREPIKTDQARSRLHKSMSALAKEDAGLTMGVPGPSQIRLDVSTLHQKGSLRAEYSLNRKTGLVAMPVHRLDAFEKEHAKPDRVLASL